MCVGCGGQRRRDGCEPCPATEGLLYVSRQVACFAVKAGCRPSARSAGRARARVRVPANCRRMYVCMYVTTLCIIAPHIKTTLLFAGVFGCVSTMMPTHTITAVPRLLRVVHVRRPRPGTDVVHQYSIDLCSAGGERAEDGHNKHSNFDQTSIRALLA